MSNTAYDRRAAKRHAERERSLCGETLSEFHARENPARTAPGAGIPRVRCDRTPSLFGSIEAAQADRDKWTERQGSFL